MEYFISHASEDKQDFVRELANHFIRNGATVFYDEYTLKLGDSLFDKINEGIKEAKNCIVVLSKYFFEKKWTMAELRAIFGKHVDGEIKLITIYHNIKFEEIKKEYPILADILGVNSDIGFEKVAEKIFEATGYEPKMGYGKIDFSQGGDFASKEGFSIAIRFSLPRRANPKIPKYLYESGVQNQFNSRVRIIILNNERLYFEIVTEDFQVFSVSTDISSWEVGEPHLIVGNLDTNAKAISLYEDGKLKSEIKYRYIKVPSNLFRSGIGMIGCSLELDFPCPFTISYHSIGKSFSSEEVKKLTKIAEEFNRTLGR